MKKVLLFVSILTLLCSSASVFAAPFTNEEKDVITSISIREQLGFNTKISDVRNIESNAAYQDSKKIYGIALTEEEVAEMNIRDSLLGEAAKLEKIIYPELTENTTLSKDQEELKKLFAGLYLDNIDKGTIKIGIVNLEQNSLLAEEMLKLFSKPQRVKFFNASINKLELSSIQDELTPLFSEFPITESSVSLAGNKVIIGVQDLSLTNIIEKRLSNFAKDHVEFVLKSEVPQPFNTRATYSYSLRGGLAIDRPEVTPTGTINHLCSSAFNTRKQQPNGTYLYYVITAAHCGDLASVWNQGGTYFGSASYRNFGGQSDILAIQIGTSGRASAQIQNADNDFVNINQYETSHTVGTYVCIAGRNNTSPTCGTIIDNDFSTSYPTATFAHMVKVNNNQTSGGDSGGAVYARIPNEPYEKRSIYGVLSGGVTNDWYFYSKAGRVFTDLSMSQILTSSVSFP